MQYTRHGNTDQHARHFERQAEIQGVLQLDKADYSLEAGQHQLIHTNTNALLGRANRVCVQRLCGDRVNIC